MKTLIFDVETIGERWEEMDEPTRAFFEYESASFRRFPQQGIDTICGDVVSYIYQRLTLPHGAVRFCIF